VKILTSGTLTILMLDIADAARLLQYDPSGTNKGISLCNELAEQLAHTANGEVQQQLSIENSLLAVFPSASKAVEAASILHRSMSKQDWHPAKSVLRTAIVTGDIEYEQDSYEGPVLHTLFAMKELARPGQILVGEATHAIVRQKLSDGHSFLDLGLHHLEDMMRAQTLFQLLHPELPDNFQPLPSLLSVTSNLPRGLTAFVGRHAEVEEIRERFYLSRVVVLTGFGGVGKSRLSIEVANQMLEDHYHGACYVNLNSCETRDQLTRYTATALGVREIPNVSLENSMLEKLRASEMLLLFDNADEVTETLPTLIGRIVDVCPHIQVLVTCRRPLTLAGAQHHAVQPLAVPAVSAHRNLRALAQVEAVELFLKRACLVKEDFELVEANSHAVAAICRKLEGIPLAIELAASKLRKWDVQTLLAGLEDRFALLTGPRRKRSSRILENALQWSFDLLSEPEKRLLTRLSVFRGEFTEAAVKGICTDDVVPAEMVGSLLRELAAQSLVIVPHSEPPYYDVLDTVREFSLARLIEAERVEVYMERHAAWFTAYAEEHRETIYGAEQTHILHEFERVYENLLTAIKWSISADEADDRACRIVLVLYLFWFVRSLFAEGLTWAEAALTRAVPDAILSARVRVVAGTMASSMGAFDAADRHFKKAISVGQTQHAPALLLASLGASGTNYIFAGRYEQARLRLEECLAMARLAESAEGIADALNNLGVVLVELHQIGRAQELLCESLAINRGLNRSYGVASNVFCLGRCARFAGEIEASHGYLEEALRNYIVVDDPRGIAAVLRELAYLAIENGIFHRAACLLGAEEAIRGKVFAPVPYNRQKEAQNFKMKVKGALQSRFSAEFKRGSDMSMDQVQEFVLFSLGNE
jgi:predicted ATPase/class 3 adenylate cyclase